MDKENIVKKAMFQLKNLEEYVPLILSLDSEKLSSFLLKIQKEKELSLEQLGDFIQDILVNKHHLIKKKPEFKDVLLKFVKENRILGIISQFY